MDETRSLSPDSRIDSRSGSPQSIQMLIRSNGSMLTSAISSDLDEMDSSNGASPLPQTDAEDADNDVNAIMNGTSIETSMRSSSLLVTRKSLAASNPNISSQSAFGLNRSSALEALLGNSGGTAHTSGVSSTVASATPGPLVKISGMASSNGPAMIGQTSGQRHSIVVMSSLKPSAAVNASSNSGRKQSISICFICELPILTHQCWSTWPSERSPGLLTASGAVATASEPQYTNVIYHDDCLTCSVCSARLKPTGAAKRHGNGVYCPLHYADVSGLGSGGDEFMAKLRDFKRQSLGCAGNVKLRLLRLLLIGRN
jgi:hypothetical protein